jgi:hypothetical protein
VTIISLILCSAIYPSIFGRNVVIDVKAPWKRYSTSFSAELSEFISEHSSESFWKFVEGMCSDPSKIESAMLHGSHESCTDLQSVAFEIGTTVVPQSLHTLMDTLLGLGAYAPAVQFFESISEPYNNPCEGGAFVATFPGNKVFCTATDISSWIDDHDDSQSQYEDIFSVNNNWDHVFPIPEDSKAPTQLAVLYGSVGTTSFCSLHASLASLATASRVKYSLRHAFHGAEVVAQETKLQGYGVFLDIKNMEYKTVDDQNDQVEANAATRSDDKVSTLKPHIAYHLMI